MPLTLRMPSGGPSGAAPPEASSPSEPTAPATPKLERTTRPPKARRCPTCRQTFSGESRFCPFDGMSLVDAPDWNPAADPLLGQIIEGRYEVLAVVGEGGMGTVYEVRHTSLGRLFAMKVLRRDIAKDADLVARFVQEAKAAAAIGHPNIVAVSDFGEIDPGTGTKLPYFVMEFLTGTSLAALLRAEKRLPAPRVGALLIQCAAALEAAHRAGIIHRDLKPDNIFLIKHGDHEFVKLLDFGVAKIAGGKRLTRIGMVFGTPHYMSPEQAEGKRIDVRTDVYALGVIMYECFGGRVPFEADTYMGVLTQHMFAVPEPIEKAVPEPAALGGMGPIVMRCLAKQAEDRYASMTDLSAAIDAALQAPSRPTPAEERRRDSQRRLATPTLADGGARRDSHRRLSSPALVVERAPVEAPSSLSTTAKIVIAIAAIGVPIALALGFRVWRDWQAEPAPPASAPAAATPTVALPPGAQDAVITAPTASPPPIEPPAQQAAKPEPSVKAGSTEPASSAPAPARSTPARSPRRQGEIVDPWSR